jgi:SLIT-ROBO Rho GTPase activating protein
VFLLFERCLALNKGIFRVPGAQVDINQFKDVFERGDDPLVNVTSRDMNSVAGVLKLYFRELKEPLVSRDLFDLFIACLGQSSIQQLSKVQRRRSF